jgi:hypothetical protein
MLACAGSIRLPPFSPVFPPVLHGLVARVSHMCAVQPDAMAVGKTLEEILREGVSEAVAPHKVMPGNRPSNVLLLPRLTAYETGQVGALFLSPPFLPSACLSKGGVDKTDWRVSKERRRSIGRREENFRDSALDLLPVHCVCMRCIVVVVVRASHGCGGLRMGSQFIRSDGCRTWQGQCSSHVEEAPAGLGGGYGHNLFAHS